MFNANETPIESIWSAANGNNLLTKNVFKGIPIQPLKVLIPFLFMKRVNTYYAYLLELLCGMQIFFVRSQ
jgi:hypothetical protein